MKLTSLALIFVISLTGCSTNRGPQLVRSQRFDYSQKFTETEQEQMVMNLVRLRYHETPVFLELSSIVTQYTIRNFGEATTTSIIGLVPGTKTTLTETPKIGVSSTFEERPTITYTPLQGEEFATRILSPIAPSTIFLLSQAGWSISRLMRLCIQKINGIENAMTAAGPTPTRKPIFEDFLMLTKALRILQKEKLVTFSTFEVKGEKSTSSFVLSDIPNGESQLKEMAGVIRNLLGSSKDPNSGQLTLHTRSLLGVFFYLSHAVDPPQEHIEKGYVTITKDKKDNLFDWTDLLGNLLIIKSQKKEPMEAFVHVRYRGYWFYVDNSALNSKDTLGLLSYLLALQSAKGEGHSPLLTIS